MEHLQPGDRVKVLSDGKLVRKLQVGHGEWNHDMTQVRMVSELLLGLIANLHISCIITSQCQALGQMGKVTKMYADGDARVLVCNRSWTFNPALLQKISSTQDANTLSSVTPRHSLEQPSKT